MRSMRNSTMAAREKAAESAPPAKKERVATTGGRSKKDAEPPAKKAPEAKTVEPKEPNPAAARKTRGRITPTDINPLSPERKKKETGKEPVKAPVKETAGTSSKVEENDVAKKGVKTAASKTQTKTSVAKKEDQSKKPQKEEETGEMEEQQEKEAPKKETKASLKKQTKTATAKKEDLSKKPQEEEKPGKMEEQQEMEAKKEEPKAAVTRQTKTAAVKKEEKSKKPLDKEVDVEMVELQQTEPPKEPMEEEKETAEKEPPKKAPPKKAVKKGAKAPPKKKGASKIEESSADHEHQPEVGESSKPEPVNGENEGPGPSTKKPETNGEQGSAAKEGSGDIDMDGSSQKIAEPTSADIPTKDKESVADDKENKSAKSAAKVEGEVLAASPKRSRNSVSGLGLEDEADEDSANEKISSPVAEKEKKPKKRVTYDKELVEKAAQSVIDGKMGPTAAAKEFGVSPATVTRRVKMIRNPSDIGSQPKGGKKRKMDGDASEVQVIRVEDLD